MEEKNVNTAIFDEEEIIPSERLVDLLLQKKYAEVKANLEDLPAPDLAELFSEIDERYHSLLFRLLSKELAAETFVEMDTDLQENLITKFTDRELSDILDELYIDDTVDIIEEMPANVVKRILKNSDKEDREIINRILKYPKDSAGTVMTTEYVRFTGDMTVADALLHIRRVAIDKETIYTCYITGKDKRLEGIVTAKDLLISAPELPLTEIMDENVIAVHTHDDKEEVLTHPFACSLVMPQVVTMIIILSIVTPTGWWNCAGQSTPSIQNIESAYRT